MKDLEKILKKAPCRDVPDRLDRKMEMEFQQAEEKRWVFFSRPIPLWIHVSACLACLCVGFLFHSILAWKSEEPRLVYLVTPNKSFKLFLDQTKTEQNDSFKGYKVRIKIGRDEPFGPPS